MNPMKNSSTIPSISIFKEQSTTSTPSSVAIEISTSTESTETENSTLIVELQGKKNEKEMSRVGCMF